MKNFILRQWEKIPDPWKIKIISGFNTFASVFILTLATTIVTGGISWSIPFWGALISAAGREAFKAVTSQFVPVRLGGKK